MEVNLYGKKRFGPDGMGSRGKDRSMSCSDIPNQYKEADFRDS